MRRVVLEESLIGYAIIWRGRSGRRRSEQRHRRWRGVVRDRLLKADAHGANASAPATYDGELVAAVRGVQRDFGLRGDGVVGPETFLALMAAERSGPHLRKLAE